MWDKLKSFVNQCDTSQNIPHLYELLENSLSAFGFRWYAFGNLYGDSDSVEELNHPGIKANYPDNWVSRYFEREYFKIDPVVQLSQYAVRYMDWKCVERYQPAFFRDAREHGLKAGYSIPLRSYDGCYVLSVASDNDIDLDREHLSIIELLASHFFRTYLSIRRVSHEPNDLSDNQVYALQATMLGKRPKEIAGDLNKSLPGVYWMLDDARKKMRCETVPQLVMKAVQQGILTI